MYITATSLEPLLPPRMYCTAEAWQQERQAVFADAWHLVTSASLLRRHGQYVSIELLGIPLVVRNFDGELVAVRNVCAHRHSVLVSKSAGQCETLKCPYHGWEYGADGRTRRLPGALNFPNFDHERYCLDRFPVATCGDLVFVRLSQQGPTLEDWIGERFELFKSWFSPPQWTAAWNRRFDYPCNWKIPVEASLESYHIPCVHPTTFYVDPGDAGSTHHVHDSGTSFETQFQSSRWVDRRMKDLEEFVLGVLGDRRSGGYQHHHVFPHLLISKTDTVATAQMVHPLDQSRSFNVAWQFARSSESSGIVPRLVAYGWGRFTGYLTNRIVNEDIRMFPLIQAGVTGAVRTGILGRCEERLHASQKYVRDHIAGLSMDSSNGENGVAALSPTAPESRDDEQTRIGVRPHSHSA